jgi:hypothetical protein
MLYPEDSKRQILQLQWNLIPVYDSVIGVLYTEVTIQWNGILNDEERYILHTQFNVTPKKNEILNSLSDRK